MTGTTAKRCDNCGSEAPASQQSGHYIDDGWSLNYLSLGHYGGFTDCIPDPDTHYDDDRYYSHLCHDCCVVMMRAMPGLARQIFSSGAGHPNRRESHEPRGTATPSCCEWAWTWNTVDGKEITYFGTPDGGWVTREEWINRVAITPYNP